MACLKCVTAECSPPFGKGVKLDRALLGIELKIMWLRPRSTSLLVWVHVDQAESPVNAPLLFRTMVLRSTTEGAEEALQANES